MPVTTDQVIPRPLGVSLPNRHSVLYCIVLHSQQHGHLTPPRNSQIGEEHSSRRSILEIYKHTLQTLLCQGTELIVMEV